MKILTISNCPAVESQGSGYVIVNYAERMRARGHTVDLHDPSAFTLAPRLNKARFLRQVLGMARFASTKFRGGDKYDVIEFYGAESWLAMSLLSRVPRRNFILVAHSNGLETQAREILEHHFGTTSLDGRPLQWHQKLSMPIDRAFRRADGIITVSDYDRQYALRHSYQPDDRVIAIDNPLPDAFLGLPLQLDRPARVGFCGSWIKRKGIDTLVADATALLDAIPTAELCLAGVGASFHKQDIFPARMADRIEVHPFLETKGQMRKFYESVSVLVCPSIYESFGLVCAEAMACGCAVIATPTGFAAGLRDGVEIRLMKSAHSPSLFDAMKELLLAPELRAQMATAGHRRVQSLRWDDAVTRLESTYRKWIEAAIPRFDSAIR